MIRLACVCWLAIAAFLYAREEPDTTAPAQVNTPPASVETTPILASPSISPAGPVSPFYHPPMIREKWDRYYQMIIDLDESVLTKRFVLALMDSLSRSIQADFDSLAVRARAFETRERGYTQRFYRSPLTRDEILGNIITEQEAEEMPHFHAVYDPQGYLLRVRYVEPRKWRLRQELIARGMFRTQPTSPPLVRYFQDWDVRHLEPLEYSRKKKISEGESYIRVIYDSQDNIQSLQSYDQHGELEYNLTVGRVSADGSRYARLEFAGDSSGSLLSIHPYVYLRDWSVVKPGWKVAITRDADGNLASTQVFNQLNQISYYYTFSFQVDSTGGNRTLRGTVLSDQNRIEQVFAILYDQKDRMIRRSFYTTEGELLETTTYDYQPKSSEVVVITRNALGVITARQRFVDRNFWY